jgi:hypothetical protein
MAFLGGIALLLGALAWPLVFAGPWFLGDGPLHAWLLWHQSFAISESHLPGLLLNYSNGIVNRVFYPEYAFYGGTIYGLAGAISLALGKAPQQAYILGYLLGFVAAGGGWYWMARMAGLGRWVSHVPGMIFLTSDADLRSRGLARVSRRLDDPAHERSRIEYLPG